MADAVISVAVNKLSDLLIQQAEFLYGASGQVQQLQNELTRMQCFLKDADAKQLGDARIHNWVSEIRDVAYDSEDVIETFILQIEEKEKRTGRWGFRAALKRYSCIGKKGMKLHNIGKDIKVIQERLQDISKNQVLYGLQNLGQLSGCEGTSSSTRNESKFSRRSSPLHVEEDFVGLNDAVEALTTQLIGDEASLRVISIYGMGGLGKTSLAKKLYNHEKVRSHFSHHCAWVYVSQEYDTKDLLQKIIKSFRKPSSEEMKIIEMSTVDDLEEQLHDLLEHHRYLVVIDDVWHLKAWESLKKVFPNKKNRSRVLLTTRKKNIAERADLKSIPHELRFLDKHESWELFCKIVFGRNNDDSKISCPSHLESLGLEMVGKCGGLPLGILVLGGLLLDKTSTHEWQKVLDGLTPKLMQDQDQMISQILALSYNDLPYELKPCFLHLGLYPEDFVIDAEKLIKLWLAEGFIIPRGKESMEDVGRGYLNDLINRSMIHVQTMNGWQGVVECNIHDLIRDLAIEKAKEVSFLHIYRKDESAPSSATSATTISRVRRLAIHSEIQSYALEKQPHWHLRALMVFNKAVIYSEMGGKIRISQKQLSPICKGFKLLRVLDLGGSTFDEGILPDGIGELIHLRYLGLNETNLKKLPASIGKLQRLQTLNLRYNCVLRELPDAVGKLGHLRHFYGNWSKKVCIDTLKNLRTLNWIDVDVFKQYDQTKLTNLQNLTIRGVTCSVPSRQLCLAVNGVSSNCLQSLVIDAARCEYNPISLGFCYCKNLLHLELNCCLMELPNLPEYTPYLIHLVLDDCELKEDPMPTLERLQNLSYLHLGGMNGQGRMICSATGFPQLKTLHMSYVYSLQEWTIEKGAMPRLKKLEMKDIKNLKEIPEGFKFLTTLRDLNVHVLSKDLKERWRGEENCCKIQHIPSVTIS